MAGVTFELDLATQAYRRALAVVTRETARSTRSMADEAKRIDSAWQGVGQQSTRDLTRELVGVNASFLRVANSGTASADDIARAYTASRQRIHQLRVEAGQVPAELRETVTAAQRVSAAFETLNVRSASDIRAEMRRVNTAVRTVGRSSRSTGQDMRRAAQAGKTRMRELRAELKRVETGTDKAGAKANLLGAAFGAVSVAGLVQLSKSLIDAEGSYDGLIRALNVGAGSVEAGTEELGFVRREADRLGFSFEQTASAYSKFINATKGTAAAGDITREAFLGVLEGARALNLDIETTQGALLALGQIAGKGKVSMEELRGQLGERLPGAMQIAARAMGVSSAELEKMVAAGIPAGEFLEKFGPQMRREFGAAAQEAAGGLGPAFERMQTAMYDLRVEAANSGIVEYLADMAVITSTELLPAVSSGIKGLATFGAALAHLDALMKQSANDLREGIGLDRVGEDALHVARALSDAQAQLDKLRADNATRRLASAQSQAAAERELTEAILASSTNEVKAVQRVIDARQQLDRIRAAQNSAVVKGSQHTAEQVEAIERASVRERARIVEALSAVGRDDTVVEVAAQAAREIGARWGELDEARQRGDEAAIASAEARYFAIRALAQDAVDAERERIEEAELATQAEAALATATADHRKTLLDELALAEAALDEQRETLAKKQEKDAKAAVSARVKAEKQALDEIASLREEATQGLGDAGGSQGARAIENAGEGVSARGQAWVELGRVQSNIREAQRAGDADALKAARDEAQAIHEQVGALEDQTRTRDLLRAAEDAYKLAASGAADELERQVESSRPVTVEVQTDDALARVAELKAQLVDLGNVHIEVEEVLSGFDPGELVRKARENASQARAQTAAVPIPGLPADAELATPVRFIPDTTEADAAAVEAVKPLVRPVVYRAVTDGVTSYSGAGGAAPAPQPLARGGGVGPPGRFGGGDQWPILGESGEYMLNKHAVRALTLPVVERLNALRQPVRWRGMNLGGAVGGATLPAPVSGGNETSATVQVFMADGQRFDMRAAPDTAANFADAVRQYDRKLGTGASGAA